jgi:SAM-dependent methyltransferase
MTWDHDSLPPPFRRLPKRIQIPEILDESGAVTTTELQKSLNAMAAVNRHLGGTRSLLRHLRPLTPTSSSQELSLLDVGVGGGQVPRTIQASMEAADQPFRWIGIDRNRNALSLAAHPERGAMVQADALTLPFADDTFDVVISTLTLHHFSDEDTRLLLAESARVARQRVIMSDLERHPLHYLGARILALTWWRRDPVTRFDGPASVLRSFTPDELREIARGVAFREVRIHRHLPFRLVLDGVPG